MMDLHQHIAAARKRLARIQRAHPAAFLALVIVVSVVTLMVFAGSLWLTYDVAHDLPSASQLRDVGSMAQATTLYDKDNRAVFTIFQERRVETPLSDMSPLLVHAIVAVEDQRFYDHGGVDLVRIFAAAVSICARTAQRRAAARSLSSWRARVS